MAHDSLVFCYKYTAFLQTMHMLPNDPTLYFNLLNVDCTEMDDAMIGNSQLMIIVLSLA